MTRLNELISRAKALVEGKVKGPVDYLQKQAKEVKKGLYSFAYSTNFYQKDAYKLKQEDVKLALNKLENRFFHNAGQSDKSDFFRPEAIIPISLVVVALIGITVAVIIRKRKQNKLKK